ncbi:F-box protein At4g00755-like isoform X2 [Phalaenopsis equestris]|uniref:F-box protein At4g00755-like isoform X2 n=1 Tax=Phalaenopsis equestris TaxID=78828 RepID=UPI0009E32C88|nr:F-box protein At4g00755-like isoform X2 [Phalaenopsis equestris]
MKEQSGGDLLERLGSDLSAAILLCLDDPADLVRLASLSKSWRIFVISNGFCKRLCLRTNPEISCFVRAIEVGGLSTTAVKKVGSNCSGQWHTMESEHRIFAYFGYRSVSSRFFTETGVESISASNTNAMLPGYLGPNMFSSFWSNKRKSTLTFRLSCKLCVIHEIKIQLPQEFYCRASKCRFRLGHMRNENATPEELLAEDFIWTYVSPEFSMVEIGDFQSLKLQRPVVCIGGVLQFELLSRDPSDESSDMRTLIMASRVKAIVCPLAPAFEVSLLDRMGDSILMYFPGAIPYLEDFFVQEPSFSSRRKFWRKAKRRRKNW